MTIVPNQWPRRESGYRIAFVGESPGSDEVRLGTPFCGASGHLLKTVLGSVGLSREECFVGNVVQVQPKGNDFSTLDWTGDLVQSGIAQLLVDLLLYRPHLIVTLGNVSLHLLHHGNVAPPRTKAGYQWPSKVTLWRGSLFLAHETLAPGTRWKTLSTLHPAYVLRAWSKATDLRQDLRKAREEGSTATFDDPCATIDMAWGPGVEDDVSAQSITPLEVCTRLSLLLERQSTVGFDTEGVGWPTCMGFATHDPSRPQPWRVLVVDCLALKSHPAAKDIWRLLQQVIESPRVRKICWNAAHERAFLQLRLGWTMRNFDDALFAFHERFPELPKGLKYAASLLTRLPCWTEGISWNDDDDRPAASRERLWTYNAYDCVATLQLAMHPQLRPLLNL